MLQLTSYYVKCQIWLLFKDFLDRKNNFELDFGPFLNRLLTTFLQVHFELLTNEQTEIILFYFVLILKIVNKLST